MERVAVLINKLQEQLKQQAEIKNMLVTAQMLETELLQKIQKQNGHSHSKVSVIMPHTITLHAFDIQNVEVLDKQVEAVETPKPEVVEVRQVVENVDVPEPEVKQEEAMVEPVVAEQVEPSVEEKRFAPQPNGFNRKEPSGWLFDPTEVPTLAHQDKVVYELNDTMLSEIGSLNESLKEQKSEMGSLLQETPIRDLKKAISINERHRFIHDLFRGDETMYERSIKTINGFNIFPEAEYWIQRELKLKLGWDLNNDTVKSFDQLVKRRFA